MQESQIRIKGEISLESFLCYVVLFLSVFIILTTGYVLSIIFLINDYGLWIILTTITYLIGLLLILKNLTIGIVILYKILAPKSLRNKCRFEPTCSSYMIMSLQKYGFFKGLKKGINRIRRCHYPNGGVDYP